MGDAIIKVGMRCIDDRDLTEIIPTLLVHGIK